MTMPYLNDIDEYEWSWVDCVVIIFNLCIGFIFGWGYYDLCFNY